MKAVKKYLKVINNNRQKTIQKNSIIPKNRD